MQQAISNGDPASWSTHKHWLDGHHDINKKNLEIKIIVIY